jgi:hypothetical protein
MQVKFDLVTGAECRVRSADWQATQLSIKMGVMLRVQY